jgi:hypothetical protein
MMTEATTSPARRRGVTIAIWAATVLFMFTAAAYQRRTGPSYEFRGDYQVQGVEYEYALIRNHETTGEAVITLPAPTDGVEGSFFQRRYPTTDAYTETPLVASADGMLSGNLSVQPAAGKVEYYIVLQTPEGAVTIPESAPTDGIILRYKDPVPLPVLLSHVLLMAFSVLVGIRAGLGAAFSPSGIRRWVWVTLLGMSIGGMLLGPIVQKDRQQDSHHVARVGSRGPGGRANQIGDLAEEPRCRCGSRPGDDGRVSHSTQLPRQPAGLRAVGSRGAGFGSGRDRWALSFP